MTVAEALHATTARLAGAGCPSPRVDAEHLLVHALGRRRSELYVEPQRSLDDAEAERLEDLVRRRERREPLAYVLGEWGFRRLRIKTDARALVPRPETEVVVERCLALLAGVERPRVLDVGVGSGAIALAIADEHPGAHVVATDRSLDALSLAADNRAALGHEDRVELVHGDLFASVGGRFDLVVSNPPYVAPDEIEALEPEVRDYEPRLALVGEGVTEAIVRGAPQVLLPGGALVLEVADGAAAGVAAEFEAAGFSEIRASRDLAGVERIVEGRVDG